MSSLLGDILRVISAKYRRILWWLLRLVRHGKLAHVEANPAPTGHRTALQETEQYTISEKYYRNYLTAAEADQIREQFQRADDGRRLLFWTNIPRELAQAWANANGANTLTTMMGRLMEEVHTRKRASEWSRYVKGVSCLFAELARQKSSVIVLTTPPGIPRWREASTFRSLEEPILKLGGDHLQIIYIHPTVQGAETVEYTQWPEDRSALWVQRFGNQTRIDAMTLLKRFHKGMAGPCFSIDRLPPLRIENIRNEFPHRATDPVVIITNAPVPELTYVWRVKGMVADATSLLAKSIIRATRIIVVWIMKWQICTFSKCFKLLSSPFVRSTPQMTGQQPGSTGPKAQPELRTTKIIHKAENSSTAALNVDTRRKSISVDLTSLQRPLGDRGSVKPNTVSRESISSDQWQINLPEHSSKKALFKKLKRYPLALESHSKRTGVALRYEVGKVGQMHTTALFFGRYKFRSQETNKKLSRRLAETQACQYLDI